MVLEEEDLDSESAEDRDQAAAICFSQWNDVKENAADMRFACNKVQSGVRKESWEGREWLVAPVVALRAGVLNGELVSDGEVLNHPEAWNGRPVVVYHPQDEEGRHVGANSPEVLSRKQIGQLFNVNAEPGDGASLKGEMWIDIRKAMSLSGEAADVVRRLEKGDPLEVSTAYYRDVVMQQGEHQGKPYETIAKSLKPDHLAALPNAIGACSWGDGCGAPRLNMRSADSEEMESRAQNEDQQLNENNGGSVMDERIESILEDGRLAFNREQLEAMDEATLGGILAALEAMPEEETDPEPDPDPEPQANENQGQAPETVPDPRVAEFLEQVEAMGGVEALREVVVNYRQEAERRVQAVVGRLAANEACTFSREQLETMTEDQLISLEAMLTPADYTGRGSRLARNDGEEELAMPALQWGQD
jgi:hypothetical protein